MQKTVQMAVQIVYLPTKPIIALVERYAICILWINLYPNGNICPSERVCNLYIMIELVSKWKCNIKFNDKS